ncbi:MAG: hypothetical protein IJG24_06795, partial [Selenomonadaceae bacterium]|nr:hypothetical protein [Selenomonadaceae bacterium]
MLTTKEFAEASGVPYGTLRRWRSKYRGTNEGKQGVLMPAHVDEHGRCFYDESQIDRARRLHNPNYGLKSLFEEMNDMTTNPLEIDAHNVAGQLFDAAVPVPDNANAAQVAPHAPNDSDDAEPVTIKQFSAWCSLVQKIRDGQPDCVNRLRRELKDNTGIIADRQQLIDLAGGKDCYHNFRVFLSQFNLDFVDDNGELQRLVTHEDGNCRFESVLDADAPEGLIVDEEFKSLIPPLSDDERRQLEKNILQDGIRDPLVVWQGHGIIVDGHNRHSIATKHGLPFKTREIAFADRDAVKLWIVQNQFGRRNVNRYSRGELALKLEPSIAAQAKANQVRKSADFVLSTLTEQTPIDTRTELAKIAGISTGTMAKIKYLVENASGEVKVALRADEITINRAFAAVKAGAVTVEDVLNFKPDRKIESPSPKPPEP